MLTFSSSRNVFSGNGVAVEFPFTFKVWSADQLRVVLTDPKGVDATATGWTAALADTGGTLTYRKDGKPLPKGWKLTVLRNMPFVQRVDLISGTRFDPQVIEDQMDQAAAERQQLLEEVGRAVKVPPASDNPPEILAELIFEARDRAASSAGEAAASADRAESEADRAQAEADSLKKLSVDVEDAPHGTPTSGIYDPATGVLTLRIPEGATGPQGPQGGEGPQGVPGAQGQQGPRGIQGIQGNQGERGPEGQQGLMGPQGVQGPRGEQGDVGPMGPEGIQGKTGERGPQGVEGPKGAVGDKGPLGDSPLPLTFGNFHVTASGYLQFEYSGGPVDESLFQINPATGEMEVML